MLTKALFFALVALSLGYTFAGLRRREGILEFPVLFSGAFAFSIVPQLINHVFYPGRLPDIVYRDHGIELGIFMCILCLLAGNAGYKGRTRDTPTLRRLIPDAHPERMFWVGVILILVGLYGAWRVTEMAGGLKARYTEGGHYGLQWSGAPVLWTYVGKLMPLGMVLTLNSALIRGTIFKWGISLLPVAYALAAIVFLGRRSATFALPLTILCVIWFRKRWALPRWVSIAGLAAAGLIIILLPYYRGYASKTGDLRGAIRQVDVREALTSYAVGARGEGMDNLIVGMPARTRLPSFGLGTGFWDGAVDYLVPGQIIGYERKKAMMLKLARPDDETFMRYCGLLPEFDAFSTGPYSVFREFWFLGCLVFFAIAAFFRRLWSLASSQGHLGAQVLYIASLLLVPMSVVNSVTDAFPPFLFAVGVLWPALWLGQRTGPPRSRRRRGRGRRARRGRARATRSVPASTGAPAQLLPRADLGPDTRLAP